MSKKLLNCYDMLSNILEETNVKVLHKNTVILTYEYGRDLNKEDLDKTKEYMVIGLAIKDSYMIIECYHKNDKAPDILKNYPKELIPYIENAQRKLMAN